MIIYLIYNKPVFAQDIKIQEPNIGVPSYTSLGTLIGNALGIAMVFGMIIVLGYIIWGAFEWITSGGDKEKLTSARERIVHALIGLFILAVAFVIARVAGEIVGIDILNIKFPTLGG